MSPSSSSKSKDKSAAKAVKEQPKASSKASTIAVNGGNGVAANAYNPISGTFHALDTAPSSTISTTPQSNGRFPRTVIDETEEYPGSLLYTTADYDCVSNNDDSCSGESEDQQKDKNNAANNTSRADPTPGSDVDKREKIRLKNEKKHQRQKERRAQELHERCCCYLTSRKLESLAQKLVAMGFTSEKATMALIHNEGRVEESVLWLLERGEESKQVAATNPDNAKIDIADELAKIVELEVNFKCTKQEVERAVVACEGDLDKVEEALKAHRQETPPAYNQHLEEFGDQRTVSANGFHNGGLNSNVRTLVKGPSIQLQRREERDFNCTKSSTIAVAVSQMETASRNLQQQPLRKVQPNNNKSDWIKAQTAASSSDKRWPSTSSLASPLQVSATQTNPENRYATTTNGGSHEVKANLLLQGTLREPIYVMQRPQSNGTRQNGIGLGSSPPSSTGWFPGGATNAMEIMKQKMQNMTMASSRSSNPQQFYPQEHHHHHNQQFISSSMGSGSYNIHGTPPTRSSSSLSSLAVPSSLGLFTGWGSSGTSPHVDWNTTCGSMPQCDYTSIDWSLDLTPMAMPSSSIKGERLYDNSWHASYTTPTKAASSRSAVNGLRHDGSLGVDHYHHHPAAAPSARSPEWTSPFAGKDVFRAPRQFVTSPSP